MTHVSEKPVGLVEGKSSGAMALCEGGDEVKLGANRKFFNNWYKDEC